MFSIDCFVCSLDAARHDLAVRSCRDLARQEDEVAGAHGLRKGRSACGGRSESLDAHLFVPRFLLGARLLAEPSRCAWCPACRSCRGLQRLVDGALREDDRPAGQKQRVIVLLGDRLQLDRAPHRLVEVAAERDHAVVGEQAAGAALQRLHRIFRERLGAVDRVVGDPHVRAAERGDHVVAGGDRLARDAQAPWRRSNACARSRRSPAAPSECRGGSATRWRAGAGPHRRRIRRRSRRRRASPASSLS